MTLSYKQRIWNSNHGGLRTSTLLLGHGGSPQYWLLHVDGEETFLFFLNRRDRDRTLTLAWKAAMLNTTLGSSLTVFMNKSNITFQVARLNGCVLKKKNIFTIIFVIESLKGFNWNNIGQASQTVAQHYSSIGSMYRFICPVAILVKGRWKHHPHDNAAKKMKWIRFWATFVHMQAKLAQQNLLRMVRWVRWHCHPDTGFEIQTLEVWVRARNVMVMEASHNTEFYEWMGKKHFCFFQTAETGNEHQNLAFKAAVVTTTPGPPPWQCGKTAANTG